MTANASPANTSPARLPTVPAPASIGTVLGLDRAHWQGTLPVDLLEASHLAFVAIKATHGATGTDAAYQTNWRSAEHCLWRAPYFWLTATAPPSEQVDRFATLVQGLGYTNDDLPPEIDAEDPAFLDLGPHTTLAMLEAAILAVKERFRRVPVVYTGTWWWDRYVGGLDSAIVAECYLHFAQYPRLWKGAPTDYVAAVRALPPHGRLPVPWAQRSIEPLYWQFDGDGGLKLPNGVDADFDLLHRKWTLDDLVEASKILR
jgi:hypothetical protein